jgi:hypothetical protein
MMDEALVEIDDAKRAQMQREMGQYMYDGRQIIPIAYVLQLSAINSGRINEWPRWSMSWYVTYEAEYIELVR